MSFLRQPNRKLRIGQARKDANRANRKSERAGRRTGVSDGEVFDRVRPK